MRRRRFDKNNSLKVLLGIVAVLSMSIGVLWLYQGEFQAFYLDHQIGRVGVVINAGIATLFALGILQLFATLWRQWREERALALFMDNLAHSPARPLVQVNLSSAIADRYLTLEELHQRRAPINHAALAQVLVAEQGEMLRLARFINNILILGGVFGTIVSLSLALMGAADLLGALDNIDGMSRVVDGMSTALSTTITAIVCYVLYGFFLQQVSSAQTRLVVAIERVTHDWLLPRFDRTPAGVSSELSGLIESLRELTDRLSRLQVDNVGLEQLVDQALSRRDQRLELLHSELTEVKSVLRQGFRLPERDGHS